MEALSPKQAATRARVSVSLVYQWCAERRLSHFRLGKDGRRGKVLIEQSDLDAFLKSLRVEAGSDETAEGFRHIRHR